jgi:hypothetical protein
MARWRATRSSCSPLRLGSTRCATPSNSPSAGRIEGRGAPGAIRDSARAISWNGERQPHFKAQRPDEVVSWIISLYPDKPGNFVPKSMLACTGEEIARAITVAKARNVFQTYLRGHPGHPQAVSNSAGLVAAISLVGAYKCN